jgi:uncharacterized protein YaiL (DUF2058 family)
MQRIKFVLWERYRAWWGAHQLNEKDPLALDRLKAEEMDQKEIAKQEALSKMSKGNLRKLERQREIQFKKRQLRRDRVKNQQQEQEMQEARDAEALQEFQKLAAGGGPEATKTT